VLSEVKAGLAKAQGFIADKTLDAWATVFMENHDVTRSVSKYGDDRTPESWSRSAKLLSMLLCTLSGTLFVYQGQEIGMTSLPETFALEDMRDVPWAKALEAAIAKRPGDDEYRRKIMRGFRLMGRDNNRTPVQWEGTSPGAGFTSAETPWIKLNESYRTVNVQSQLGVPGSILEFWKRMIQLRKSPEWKHLFIYGDFELLNPKNEKTFTFVKKIQDRRALVALNFSGDEDHLVFVPDGLDLKGARLLMSNYDDEAKGDESVPVPETLRAWEGRIYIIEKTE